MAMRPRIGPAMRAFQIAGLGHFPYNQQRPLVEVAGLERDEVDVFSYDGRSCSLIAAAQATVTFAGKGRFHVKDARSGCRERLCGEVPQIVILITRNGPAVLKGGYGAECQPGSIPEEA